MPTARDPSGELTELDGKLVDALARFDRTPGALWLAATAIIESATRLGDELAPPLAERQSDLLVRARRARDEAGPRSSENDVSAITGWVELAEKRAPLERAVLAALEEVRAHRAAHPELGEAIGSRKALERGLGVRERDVAEREARLAEPIQGVPVPGADDGIVTDTELARRSAEARARLTRSGRGRGIALAVVSVAAAIAVGATAVGDGAVRTAFGIGAALTLLAALAVLGLLGRARARDRLDAGAMRRRDERRREAAREDERRLVAAAKALGALDAFWATEDGRTLEDRESKLVTLAPWIRELVSGFTTDEASRFG